MAIFHFPRHEHKLFWRYFDCLSNFMAQYGYCLGRWKIVNVFNEGVKGET